MSKSRNRKWYEKIDRDDYDDDYGYKGKKDHRRKQRKMKNALREKDLSYFEQEDE